VTAHAPIPTRSNGDIAATTRAAGGPDRQIYIDWLRFFAVTAVFVIHVAEVFNPWDEWHITNAQRSRAVGEVAVLMAPWIMPMFMLLAGTSAWYSLSRRNNSTYLRERLVRVLLPLVVGTLVLVPPQVSLERRLRGQFTGSFLQFFPHFFEGIYPTGNLSWHHLWFLAHLFLYSVVALPLLRFWQRPAGKAQLSWLARLCSSRLGIMWLALPLVLERHLLWGLFPERHMLAADWSNHALLFVAYLYGFILGGEPWLGAEIDKQWPKALVFAVASIAMLVAGTWMGIVPAHIPPPYSPEYLVFWTLYALCAWAWMVAAIGFGRRMLTRERWVLTYSRQTGYGWYILHQPIIVAAAYWVVPWQAGVAEKLTVILVVSLAGTLAGAELLRRIPLVRTAFGVTAKAAAS
jgi:glucan biosynthesis protein C